MYARGYYLALNESHPQLGPETLATRFGLGYDEYVKVIDTYFEDIDTERIEDLFAHYRKSGEVVLIGYEVGVRQPGSTGKYGESITVYNRDYDQVEIVAQRLFYNVKTRGPLSERFVKVHVWLADKDKITAEIETW